MPVTSRSISRFQHEVLSYYETNGRSLPWRETIDPYAILISEIMLQQTQVDRVINYYKKWLRLWPTIDSLARAERKAVLTQWQGLGYNNRAIRLHETAKIIVSEFSRDVLKAVRLTADGRQKKADAKRTTSDVIRDMSYAVPPTVARRQSSVTSLPGIGPYTSCAVRIFSQNEDIVTVDTNIRRILIHEFNLAEDLSDKELWALAQQCLPQGRSRDWHNALMDYGATLVTSRSTGIKPRTQQSAFEGSDRQIRSTILKHLLASEKGEPIIRLQALVGETNFSRLQRIIFGLVKDGVIEKKSEKYIVSSR